MAYSVPFTDEANKGNITVEDKSPNNETSLTLVGRLLNDYGLILNSNFLHLLENFANVNPPSNPVEGQLWYDTTDGVDQLKIYDGTSWVAAGGLKKGQSEPDAGNSVTGDLWVDTTNSQLYLYSGSGWLLVGPTYSDGNKAGALPETITGTDDVAYTVVINYINNIPVTIISNAEFSPKSPIAGYSSTVPIRVGINPSKSLSNIKFNGLAKTAENLLISGAEIASSEFAQVNLTNQFTKKQQIRNNGGIEIGTAKTLSLIAEGTTGVIQQSISGANIDIRVNNAGSTISPIRIKSDGNIGINNLNPTESLDVTGNIQTDSNVIVGGTTESTSATTGSLRVAGGAGITKNLNVGGSATVDGSVTAGNLLPDTANVRSIGSTVAPYDSLYANRITGNLTGDVTGNVSGAAGRAAKLNSATTFNMTGDVSGTSFTFDGQVGGTSKTFTTTIDPSFVTGKPAAASINSATDEILINQGGTLVKATPNQLISTVATNPVGTVVMYGGASLPTGWLWCDGQPAPINTYGLLQNALGYDATDTNTYYFGDPADFGFDRNLYFCVPDLRGRFPLGRGRPGGANRMEVGSVETMGAVAGADRRAITVDNLPDHQHDLVDSAGNPYYATTTATHSATGTVANDGDTSGTGTRIESTGGIRDYAGPTDLLVANPYLAINFIIWTGVS